MEPGILKNFRLFIAIRLALVFNSLFYLGFIAGWGTLSKLMMLIAITILDAGLLLLYLSLPWLISLLKQNYLPVAIIWATIGPMIQVYLGFLFTQSNPIQQSMYFMTPLPFLVMFIPLVIVAWQYTQRHVLYFCITTFLMDFAFALRSLIFSKQSFLIIVSIAFIRTILFLLVGNMITNLMKVQREQRVRLTEANDNLIHYAATMEQLTISRERNRMARELHDVMAHTMSGIAVELEGVRSTLKVNPEKAEKLLDHSLHAVREGLTETRRALQALRASPLEDMGLGAAIRSLVDNIPGKTGIHFVLDINNGKEDIAADVQQCFYRIAQETLSNIVDHAQASEVTIQLQRERSVWTLFIEDNGIGFAEKSIEMEGKYGLLGMRERAEMIGGRLSITSQPGHGTRIKLVYGDKK